MSTSPTETSSSSKSVDGIARSVRVLVVDNDIVHARTMGEGLERLGYKVIVAGGGNEGVQRIHKNETTEESEAGSESSHAWGGERTLQRLR